MMYSSEKNPINIVNNGCARPGVTAGKAAGMHVIAVPSVPKKTAEFSTADEVINSLLDVKPENWGLPPFKDCKHKLIRLSFCSFRRERCSFLIFPSIIFCTGIEGTLPIEPWFIGGPVIKGFGRGSKVLGIPTGIVCYNHRDKVNYYKAYLESHHVASLRKFLDNKKHVGNFADTI